MNKPTITMDMNHIMEIIAIGLEEKSTRNDEDIDAIWNLAMAWKNRTHYEASKVDPGILEEALRAEKNLGNKLDTHSDDVLPSCNIIVQDAFMKLIQFRLVTAIYWGYDIAVTSGDTLSAYVAGAPAWK